MNISSFKSLILATAVAFTPALLTAAHAEEAQDEYSQEASAETYTEEAVDESSSTEGAYAEEAVDASGEPEVCLDENGEEIPCI